MSISIASISRTRLIGGDVGQRFNDFEKMMKNGQCSPRRSFITAFSLTMTP
jgi:hypothetical protein